MKTKKWNVLKSLALIVILIFSIFNELKAQSVYYVSSSGGDDSYDGLSASWDGTHGPWATISQVKSQSYSAGDSILFNRGDVWCETLSFTSSGSSSSPITYSAYGTGNDPIINGADTISGWTLYDATNNVWVASLSAGISSVSQVFVDGGRYTLARWPNTGWNTIDATSTTGTYLYDTSLTQSDDYWVGCTAVWRFAYVFSPATITSSSSSTNKIGFSSTGYVPKVDFGYYIEGKFEELDYAGEYYFDGTNHLLYVALPSGENPSSHTIEASVRTYGIYAYSKDYITLSGIDIKNFAHTGVYIDTCDEFTLKDCKVSYGKLYGIKCVNTSENVKIEGNEIFEIDGGIETSLGTWETASRAYGIYVYGSGLTDLDIVDNTIYNIATDTISPIRGIGISFNSGGNNSIVSGNTIYNVSSHGIAFGKYAGSVITVSGNTIYNCVSLLSDSGGIYMNGDKTGSDIRNNDIYDCTGSGMGCPSGYNYSTVVGIYFDETGSSGAIFCNNIIARCCSGIKLHKSYNVNIYNNTLYGNNIGLVLHEEGADQMYGDTIKNNIFYSDSSSQYGMLIIKNGSSTVSMGYFDNNLYYNPYTTDMIRYGTWSTLTYYTLSEWQAISGLDAGNDGNSLSSNPQLSDVSNDNFHLTSTSPCIDAGVDVGIDEDFDGVSIPQGDYLDIGAYEYQDDQTSTTFSKRIDNCSLLSCFPNPFTEEVNISYEIKNNVNVEVTIYNTIGNKIAILSSGKYKPGIYTSKWQSENYPSGIYYVQLKTSDNLMQCKLLIKK